jgi:ribonuclease HI
MNEKQEFYDKIIIFTDGSYKPDGAGIGVVFPQYEHHNLSESLPFEHKTNNRAELWAIIRSFQVIKENKEEFNLSGCRYIKIYSDSMLMVQTFNIWLEGWKQKDYVGIKNSDLLKIAYELVDYFKTIKIPIRFIHIYGHQRQPNSKNEILWYKWYCNDAADKLAKQGCEK